MTMMQLLAELMLSQYDDLRYCYDEVGSKPVDFVG